MARCSEVDIAHAGSCCGGEEQSPWSVVPRVHRSHSVLDVCRYPYLAARMPISLAQYTWKGICQFSSHPGLCQSVVNGDLTAKARSCTSTRECLGAPLQQVMTTSRSIGEKKGHDVHTACLRGGANPPLLRHGVPHRPRSEQKASVRCEHVSLALDIIGHQYTAASRARRNLLSKRVERLYKYTSPGWTTRASFPRTTMCLSTSLASTRTSTDASRVSPAA
ncbi:hypothetical protein BD413DRAFT_233919 [Trametes elegans]|nr:hypothetical protein BD413DRAFT_233919 [Trametes elegans]